MQLLFSQLVEADPVQGPSGAPLLTYRCFQAFIRAAGLIGADVSEAVRAAMLAFYRRHIKGSDPLPGNGIAEVP